MSAGKGAAREGSRVLESMGDDNTNPPEEADAIDAAGENPEEGPSALLKRGGGGGPVTSEVPLGGSVPRSDPDANVSLSGDLYIRLEGQIYGPFSPDVMEEILQSGRLTGLEVASYDLKRWTPLAYHPRIVRGRVRDFDKAHGTLRDLSALPARKHEPAPLLPLADVVRRPTRAGEAGATQEMPLRAGRTIPDDP